MAGVTKMSGLEARKRALVAESEVFREALKSDLENLRGYCDGFFKKVDRVRSFGPWLMLGIPLVVPLFRIFGSQKAAAQAPPRSKLKGTLATIMLGLRLYRKYGPMVLSLANQFLARRRAAAEARSSRANI